MKKKIYFITGLGCTGKTTLAEKMSIELGIPKFNADTVYAFAMEKLGKTREEIAPLATYNAWCDKNNDWGIYKTPEALMEICYNELFSYLLPEKLILEGQGLFLNQRENALVEAMFKDYEKRYLLVEQPYERWLKFRSKRPVDEVQIRFMEEDEYKNAQKTMRKMVPTDVWILRNKTNYDCSLTGGTIYQKPEFSFPKWQVFNFPDLKDKTFLDISCNTGWFCEKAAQQGAKVSGLDISWQVLDVAKDRVPTGTFYLTKIEKFKPAQKYDYVLCSSAFHYYHHREKQIAKIALMTDYFILETPILPTSDPLIRYQGGEDGEFCSVVSEGLILKWLKKYFTSVVKIGETLTDPTQIDNGSNRPVYRCTK